MKKHILSLASLLALGTVSAQVRVVNSTANGSVTNSPAFIDASSNTTVNGSSNVGKGLIFPRVDLSAMTAFPSVTAGIPNSFPTRFDGMIVYNTAASGTAGVGATQGTLSPGYWYYENKSASNTGGTWKPMSMATAAVANTASNGLTLSGNDVKLGGNLSQATTVTNNGNALNIAGSGSTSTFASNGYVGVGTTSPTSMLHTNGSFATRYVALSTDTTLDGTYHTVNAVHNSGTVTLTLPPVSGITGRQYTIQNNNNGITNVVVSGGGTIEGLSTLSLSQVGQTAQLIAGNSEWQLVTHAIKSASVPSGANIYTADGTLTSNRNVDTGGKNLYFTGAGNIGIGTTSPTSKLTVGGNILSSGDITATGNLAASSNLQINGNALVNGSMGAGSLTSSSTLAVGTNMQVNGTGNVNGAFGAGSLTSSSTLAVGTNMQVNGTGNINGAFGAGSLTSASTLAVATNMQVNGSGQVNGAFGANSLTSATTVAVGTNLQVNGDAQINGLLNVAGVLGGAKVTSGSTLAVQTNAFVGGYTEITGYLKAANLIATAQTGFADRYAYFDSNGAIKAGVGYPSDIRLKENVVTIQNGLQKVLALRPVSYDWKKNAKMSNHKQIGFVAQELKKVVPEVVYTENRNGYKDLNTVNYEQLTALLTKAIQEQQKQIENLKKEVRILQEKSTK